MALCIGFNEEQVNAIYPEASMFLPMKIWSLPTNKTKQLSTYADNGNYVGSLKVDGYFYSLNRTENYAYLFSRSPGVNGLLTEKIKNVPHIEEYAKKLPADTTLIGEIYYPQKTSKDVTRIMGSLPAKAIERQEKEGLIHYYLTDIVQYDGQDLMEKSFSERYQILQEVYKLYFEEPFFIELAEYLTENLADTAAKYLAAGEEGMVLRHKDWSYKPGKRPAWSSIKIKQADTLDVFITGFIDPTKEYTGTEGETWKYNIEEVVEGQLKTVPVTKAYYYGWKNAIKVSAYNKKGEIIDIGTISSGLTDELRQAFAEKPQDYLLKVVEINCMSKDKDLLTLRHGYLKQIREDKSPEECLIEDIFR